jgi:DUF4097 and DUF4098 domain-containing protein YvlB
MKILIGFCCMAIASLVNGQSFNGKIIREFSFEKKSLANTLHVANINGDITVIGYEGDKITVEIDRSISGKTTSRLEKGKEEVQLGVIDRADTIILYVKDGCNTFTAFGNNKWEDQRNGWDYNWNCNNGNCNIDYDYKMDFTIKVPSSVNVILSTVNNGDLVVEMMAGVVKANNINGSIRLSNLKREANASTINGDVDIEYITNPQSDCRFYSLNGDINALFEKGLAANMSFQSFNGEFYTNVDQIQQLPAKLEKADEGAGLKYKIDGNRYKIGSGGAFLDFETFNGNVYLKEKD